MTAGSNAPMDPTRIASLILAAALLTISAITTSPAQSPFAKLAITIKGTVRYTEGASAHFTIRRMNTVVTKFEFFTANEGNSRTLSLSPGDYELQTYVRARSGMRGGPLCPPQDQCSGTFSLKDGETLYATRAQTTDSRMRNGREGGPCKVEFSGKPPERTRPPR